MRILLLGSGGRESAIAWKLEQSEILEKLFIAPGNAGTAIYGENVNLNPEDFTEIETFSKANDIDIIVVGPEAPLVKGISDYFKGSQFAVIGPSKLGATLEGSKDFSKQFMERHNIPTAKYQSFTKGQLESAYSFLDTLNPPYVLKADGLAAGKGVLILDDLDEAKKELAEMIENNKFGEASSTVVIEEFLDGIELSVFVATDGLSYKILPEAKDYKRIGEGDTGLNTGGMGSVSPVPFADNDFMLKVEQKVIMPTIQGLKNENIDYKGFVFIGLMNVNGEPFVIEYNVRMGDPETEVVMPRIASDLALMFKLMAENKLENYQIEISEKTAACVMMVSGGYPEAYEKNKEIKGIENVNDSIVYHAGTKQNDNKVLSSGGRVLAVVSLDDNLQLALDKAYTNVKQISFEKAFYRTDIGKDLL